MTRDKKIIQILPTSIFFFKLQSVFFFFKQFGNFCLTVCKAVPDPDHPTPTLPAKAYAKKRSRIIKTTNSRKTNYRNNLTRRRFALSLSVRLARCICSSFRLKPQLAVARSRRRRRRSEYARTSNGFRAGRATITKEAKSQIPKASSRSLQPYSRPLTSSRS